MKKLMMLGAAILALQAIPALAQDAPPPPGNGKPPHEGKGPGRFFEKLDTDKDGKISKAESAAAEERRFKEMDADGDGFITKEEAKAHHDAMRAKWKEKHDEKGDKPAPKAE